MEDISPPHPGFERSSPDANIGTEAEAKISDATSSASTTYARTNQISSQARNLYCFDAKTYNPFEHSRHHYRAGAVVIPVCDLPDLSTGISESLLSTPEASRCTAAEHSDSIASSSNGERTTSTLAITAPYRFTKTIPQGFGKETPLLRSTTPDKLRASNVGSGGKVEDADKMEASIDVGYPADYGQLEKAVYPDTPKLRQRPFLRTYTALTVNSKAEGSDEYQVTFADIPGCAIQIYPPAEASREDNMKDLEHDRASDTNAYAHADASTAAGMHSLIDHPSCNSEGSDINPDISGFDVDSGYCSSDGSSTNRGSDSNLCTTDMLSEINTATLDSLKPSSRGPSVPVLTMTRTDGITEYTSSGPTLLAEAQAAVCGTSSIAIPLLSESSSPRDDAASAPGCVSDEDEFYLASQYPDVLEEFSSDDGSSGGSDSQAHGDPTTFLSELSVPQADVEQANGEGLLKFI